MEYNEVPNIDSESQKKKRKKGIVNKSQYKSEIIKKARVTGNAYTNWVGNQVSEKKPGSDCKCQRLCYVKIPEEERFQIFDKFRTFGTKNEQDSYLQSLISITMVKQRRRRKQVEESPKPERGVTFVYEISSLSGKTQVCKTAFINIHAISSERVRRLTTLLKQGKSPQDKRGKSTPGNAKPEFIINSVKEHISSFPVKIAHYSNREYCYLSERLSVLEMHKCFVEKYPEIEVSYKFYLKIFKEQFSLSFGRPQVDTCCTCEELEVKIKSKFLNDAAKRVAVAEKLVHLRRAKKFYNKIREITDLTRTDEKVGAICIDYMQNLQLPCIPVQETFYLRQLTVSVFNIHSLKDDSVVFFVYHEGIGSKGPNEVCSFLMNYLETSMKNVEHLHIFSDGCGAQNKNHTLVRMASALVSLEKFKTVEQYFPIRGHSFLPCDRDFAILKMKIKKIDRIYTLKDYVQLILTSNKKNSFLVVLPDSKDIIDFKGWWPRYYKKNMLSLESAGRAVPKEEKVCFKISQYMHFSHSNTHTNNVSANTYIDGLLVYMFKLRNSNSAKLTLPTSQAYPQGFIPINKKKMDDIAKLKPYLQDREDVKEFYEMIYAWPTIEKDVVEHELFD